MRKPKGGRVDEDVSELGRNLEGHVHVSLEP